MIKAISSAQTGSASVRPEETVSGQGKGFLSKIKNLVGGVLGSKTQAALHVSDDKTQAVSKKSDDEIVDSFVFLDDSGSEVTQIRWKKREDRQEPKGVAFPVVSDEESKAQIYAALRAGVEEDHRRVGTPALSLPVTKDDICAELRALVEADRQRAAQANSLS